MCFLSHSFGRMNNQNLISIMIPEQVKFKCPRHQKQDITRICVTQGCTKNALMCISCEQQHRHEQTHILEFPNSNLFRTLQDKQSQSLKRVLDQLTADMQALRVDIQTRLDKIFTEMFCIFDQIIQKFNPALPDLLPEQMRAKTGNQMYSYYIVNKNTQIPKHVSTIPPKLTVALLEYKMLWKEIVPKLDDLAKTSQLFDFYKFRDENKEEKFSFEDQNMKDIGPRLEKLLDLRCKQNPSEKYQTLAKKLKDLNTAKQHDQVLENCEQAIVEEPLAAPAYFEKGYALFDKSNFLQAFVNYSICGELNGIPYLSHTNRAICLIRQGMFESAIKACDMALETNKDYPNALCNKGISYQNLKKYDQALLFYQKSTKVKPDFKTAKDLMGSLLAKMEVGASK